MENDALLECSPNRADIQENVDALTIKMSSVKLKIENMGSLELMALSETMQIINKEMHLLLLPRTEYRTRADIKASKETLHVLMDATNLKWHNTTGEEKAVWTSTLLAHRTGNNLCDEYDASFEGEKRRLNDIGLLEMVQESFKHLFPIKKWQKWRSEKHVKNQ